MRLVVQKYGGSSVASPELIRKVARRIKAERDTGSRIVVVVSAMGNMTDHLLKLAQRTVFNPPQRELDMLLTAGERVTMSLLAMSLSELGVQAISFTGSQSGIVTTNDHTEARILEIRGGRILAELQNNKVVIVAGFQGVSLNKEITTLGRGGSDTTAVALAAALGAQLCEILTDVDGIFTADPRAVLGAQLIKDCSYEAALEFAWWGAKMHPRSIEIARRFQVPLRVGSAHGQQAEATCISSLRKGESVESSVTGVLENPRVVGVTSKDGFDFFRCNGRPENFVSSLREFRRYIHLFQAGESGVHFLVEESKSKSVQEFLQKGAVPLIQVEKSVSVIAVVAEGTSCASQFLPEFLNGLKLADCPCWIISTNALSVIGAIPSVRKAQALQSLHDQFFKKVPSTFSAEKVAGAAVPRETGIAK